MSSQGDTYHGTTYVVPCGAGKLDHPAPARDLYTGTHFRHTLAKATQCAHLDTAAGLGPTRVLILSALHGLVTPEQVLAPYDMTITAPGSITVQRLAEQATARGITWDGGGVYGLLPRAYLARLDTALRTLDVYMHDVYEATCGILQQKRVNVNISR